MEPIFAAVFSEYTSSGSDHSPENSAGDLFDLVKSFMEMDDVEIKEELEGEDEEQSDGLLCFDSDEEVIKLRNLFVFGKGEKQNDEIRIEVEQFMMKLAGGSSSQGIKRQLMAHLRTKGFDAGVCKSKVQVLRSLTAGDHEYMDVNLNGNRYIIEVDLGTEFEIARPTTKYKSLLNTFPEIFIGNLNELKQVVKLMCSAIKQSMKIRNMHVPPWRRNQYMLAKWFGSYKRTVSHMGSGSDPPNGSMEITTSAACFKTFHCRVDDFGQNVGGVSKLGI